MPSTSVVVERTNNLPRFRKTLNHDDACWLCPGNTKRDGRGKLVNHRLAGFLDWMTGRHVHAESTIVGLSPEGQEIFNKL
jgi:hypothetical protein